MSAIRGGGLCEGGGGNEYRQVGMCAGRGGGGG